ncbi:hypothetical protein HZS_3096 [Henneguya salminicola]|nr:hypothetical protein HZS_3096 [Henneguya salminicola]
MLGVTLHKKKFIFSDTIIKQIFGSSIIVEIDESVLVKRKYNQGRLLKTKWVYSVMERRNDGINNLFN